MDNPEPPQVVAAAPAGLPPLKEHFNRALELYKKRLKPMVLVLLAGGLLFAGIMPVMLGGGFALSKAVPKQAAPIMILAGLAALLGGMWSFSWSAAACLAALANQEAGAKECLRLAKPRVLGLVWVHMLAGLLTMGGYFLLGFPGILFTVWFFFAPFVYMSEGLGGFDALLKSREYVRGRWFATAWRLFAGWVFFFLISAIPVAGQLLGLILAPLPYILSFQVYLDLKALRGDVPFAPSGKAKAGILAAGLGGFLAVPMLIVFFFGGVLMLAFSQLKSKMPGMTAGISVNTTGPGVAMGASVKTSDSKYSIDAGVLDRVNIPDSPAAGQIQGKPFKIEKAEINGTVIKLEQGKEFFADMGFSIFLFSIDKGVSPAGKKFRYPDAKGEYNAHVHVSRKPAGESMPKTDIHMDRYAMLLEFGQEKGDKLPGKIFLRVSDQSKSEVSGRFELELKGMKMVDGHPDPKSDGSEVLIYVLRKHLEALHAGKKIDIPDSKNVSSTMGQGTDKAPLTGSGEYSYQVAGGAAQSGKFKFLKDSKGWRVSDMKAAAPAAPKSPPSMPTAAKVVPEGAVDTGRREAPSAMRHEESPLAQGKAAPAAMPPAAKSVPEGAVDKAAPAAMPPVPVSLNTDAELVKEALDACRNEIGLFCYPVREVPAEALRCLKRYEDQALEKCRQKLKEARTAR